VLGQAPVSAAVPKADGCDLLALPETRLPVLGHPLHLYLPSFGSIQLGYTWGACCTANAFRALRLPSWSLVWSHQSHRNQSVFKRTKITLGVLSSPFAKFADRILKQDMPPPFLGIVGRRHRLHIEIGSRRR